MSAVNSAELHIAAERLQSGAVVAVPTDTVYGLAVIPTQRATEKLFALKTRPDEVALPVMVADLDAALALVASSMRDRVIRLGERCWPGALTIVVEREDRCEFVLGGDPSTIGLRVSGLPVMRQLCAIAGPLAVSSANLHGEPPCTSAEAVRAVFGDDLDVLDGGRCSAPVSTVVDLTGPVPVMLREGTISLQTILDLLA